MTAPVLRPAFEDDAHAIAQLRVDAWRATYRGMIPDAYLDAMSVEASTEGASMKRASELVCRVAMAVTLSGQV